MDELKKLDQQLVECEKLKSVYDEKKTRSEYENTLYELNNGLINILFKVLKKDKIVESKLEKNENQIWFCPNLSRETAEIFLRNDGNKSGTFLVRKAVKKTSDPNHIYSLTFKASNNNNQTARICHVRIFHDANDRYYISPNKVFEELSELIEHYKTNDEGFFGVFLTEPFEKPSSHQWKVPLENIDYKKFGDILQAKKSLEMQILLFGDEDRPKLAMSLNDLGIIYRDLGEFEKALEYCLKAYGMQSNLFGDKNHPDVVRTLNYSSLIYRDLGNFKEALKYCLKAFEMQSILFGDKDHPKLAMSLNDLGIIYRDLGEFEKALECCLKAFEMQKRLFGEEDHPDLLRTLIHLSLIYEDVGDSKKVLEYVKYSENIKFRLKNQALLSDKLKISSSLIIREKFIAGMKRKKKFLQINEILSKSQGVLIYSSIGGIGKTFLANEYSHQSNETIVRWFSSDTIDKIQADYREFASFILNDIELNKVELSKIIEKVNKQINENAMKFLFIFDYLESLALIDKIIKDLPKEKVKFIITTRFDLECNFDKLNIECFEDQEANEYIQTYCKKEMTKEQINNLINLIKKHDELILPLELKLTIKNINQNLNLSIDEIFEKIKDGKRNIYLKTYLFDDLQVKSKNAIKLLDHIAFFDPDFISFNILESFNDDFKSELKLLEQYGFIETNDELKGIRMHRVIQSEINVFSKLESIETSSKIINKLMNNFNEKIQFIDINTKKISKLNNNDFIQANHILKLAKSLLEQNKNTIDSKLCIELMHKNIDYHVYCNYDINQALKTSFELYELRNNLYQGQNNPDLARSLSDIGKIYADKGEILKAEEFYQKSLKMLLCLYGQSDHSDIAQLYSNLGSLYFKNGDSNKAIDFYEKSHGIFKRLYNNKNHLDLASSLSNLASIYSSIGDENKAAEFYIESHNMLIKLYEGHDNSELASSFNNLGSLYLKQGDTIKAQEFLEESYKMRSRLFDNKDNPAIASSLNNLSLLYHKKGDLDKAKDHFVKSHEMLCRLNNEHDHPYIAESSLLLDSLSSSLSVLNIKNNEDFYKMDYSKRGMALIINNINFPGNNERKGAIKDVLNLEDVLKNHLKFKVDIYTDCSGDYMLRLLREFSNKDHSDSDCFICVVMSHGITDQQIGESFVSGSDGVLINFAKGAKLAFQNCKTLRGKPKLFFIQACRGKLQMNKNPKLKTENQKYDLFDCSNKSILYEFDNNDQIVSDSSPNPIRSILYEFDNDDQTVSAEKMPLQSDFLISCSTMADFVSVRHQENGSWYIEALCNILREYSAKENLLDMMTRLNREVAKYELNNGVKQMSTLSDYTLQKHLFFKPK